MKLCFVKHVNGVLNSPCRWKVVSEIIMRVERGSGKKGTYPNEMLILLREALLWNISPHIFLIMWYIVFARNFLNDALKKMGYSTRLWSWSLSVNVEFLKLNIRKHFYLKKTTILANLYADFDGVIIYGENLGVIFVEHLLVIWCVGLSINKFKKLSLLHDLLSKYWLSSD